MSVFHELEKVLIVTADSRILVGTLTAADNTTNLVRTHIPKISHLAPYPFLSDRGSPD